MPVSSNIAQHLPHLRRFARALSGSQSSGDAYVASLLEVIGADPSSFPDNASPRVALYKAFTRVWNSVSLNLEGNAAGEEDHGAADRTIEVMTPLPRQAFLLHSVEAFDIEEVATILDMPVSEVTALIDEAGQEIAAHIATEVLILGLFAAGFNLVFGYTGMLSLGHAAFFGLGCYASAMLLLHLETPLVLALLAATLGGGVLALLIGFFCVRLTEVYFTMLTLAFGMMVFSIAQKWRSVTNGSDGITGFSVGEFGLGIGLNLANPAVFYQVTFVVVALAAAVLYLITISPFGLILRAMAENPERVAFTGIPVRRYRLYSFAISGTFSGLAGGLYAPFTRVASPDMVHWAQSAEPVLMSILGGSTTFLGPFVGSAIFVLLETWITSYTERWMLFLGIALALMVMYLRRGLFGTAWAWIETRTRRS
jgi:branched-chain amino acid transport system permease protein